MPVSASIEQVMLQEALRRSAATESIGRKLGDELIAAARETIAAYQDIAISSVGTGGWRACRRFERAVNKLEQLVGKP
jgi:hypothetical protein